jgi:hypothetical protein
VFYSQNWLFGSSKKQIWFSLWSISGTKWLYFNKFEYLQQRQASWFSRLSAQLLLLFLRSRVEGILKDYYPTVCLFQSYFCRGIFLVPPTPLLLINTNLFYCQRTERVDKSLVDQIIRAVSSHCTIFLACIYLLDAAWSAEKSLP